jgi:pimeloyl-ACP methyl ester carboxylesterase
MTVAPASEHGPGTPFISGAGQRDAPAWTSIDWSPYIKDIRIDGRRVRYVDYGAGAPIVLIHGLGGSWQTWLWNIPTLGATHRVIAVDLPGFGRSEVLPPPAEMATHANVLAALLDDLDISSATVVAHSMGGVVSIALLGARPDLVAKLALVDAGGVPMTPTQLAMIVRGFKLVGHIIRRPGVIRAIARRPRLRRMVFGVFMADPHQLSGRFAAEVIPSFAAPGFLGAITAAAKLAGRVDPSTIAAPVLLVWGAKDRILRLAQAEELSRSLADARLVVIESAGHAPMFEAPEQFNRAVLEFVDS